MKILDIFLKVIFSLILILPIAGATGVLGEATRELYNTDLAFAFIEMIVKVGYINWMMAAVHIIALLALWTRREALASLLELPITLNVVGFHMIIDGGLLTGGASLGNIMLLINLYLLWKYRSAYKGILEARK